MSSALSDLNRAQVQRFIAYFKSKRERILQEREAEKQEFIGDRLADDGAIFNKQDVEDMIEVYHAQVAGSTRESMEGFINLSAVYVAQVLQLAENSGVTIEADLSAIEDQNNVDEIANLAAAGLVPIAMNKRAANLPSLGGAPPSPSGIAPPPDLATAARIQELEQHNAQLIERFEAMQQHVTQLTSERSAMAAELEQAGLVAAEVDQRVGDTSQFKELKAIVRKKTDEVKLLRQYITSAGLALPGTEGGFELQAEDD